MCFLFEDTDRHIAIQASHIRFYPDGTYDYNNRIKGQLFTADFHLKHVDYEYITEDYHERFN